MAAKLALPRQVLVHGHWTQNGQKMSKSLGNVVSPFEVFKTVHPDVVRYYMIKEGYSENGGNFSTDALQNRYTYLAHTWGNLVSRINSSRFNLRLAVATLLPEGGAYGGVPTTAPEEDKRLRDAIDMAVSNYRINMDNHELERSLSAVANLWRMVCLDIVY